MPETACTWLAKRFVRQFMNPKQTRDHNAGAGVVRLSDHSWANNNLGFKILQISLLENRISYA